MITHTDFDLAPLLWYKIGGKAKFLLECASKDDIEEAIDFVRKNNIEKVFVCGSGSNLIFTDDTFDGAVILLKPSSTGESVFINDKGEVEAFAGESLDKVITFSLDHNLVGLEWAGGLPGTVGAAVRGNVGAYGAEIKDTLVAAEVLDYSGDTPTLKTLTNLELEFAYRSSLVKTQKKMIVIMAKFELKKEEAIDAAQDVYSRHIQHRKDNHPLEYPNCGSVFKNLRNPQEIEKVLAIYPEFRENVEKKWHGKMAVAPLIEKLGLKGYRVGDAQVSEKHALFIVNLGHAKAKDVLEIIDTIQKKFQEIFGFKLETEVEIVE
jgi:UDP-N-acetylmuramate dehydrogenase